MGLPWCLEKLQERSESAHCRVRDLKARMGDEPETSCRCPLPPWLGISRAPQSSEGEKDVRVSHGWVGALERAAPGLCVEGFYLSFWARNGREGSSRIVIKFPGMFLIH